MNSSEVIIYGYGFPIESHVTCKTVLNFLKNHIPAIEAIYANTGDSDMWRKYLTELDLTVFEKEKLDYLAFDQGYDFMSDVLEDFYPDFYSFVRVFMEDSETIKEDFFGNLIADVMKEETGIRFTFEPGQYECRGEGSILLEETYPWNMTDAEKNISDVGQLYGLMLPYAEELGVPADEIKHQEVVYNR